MPTPPDSTTTATEALASLATRAKAFGFSVRPGQRFAHPVTAKPRSHDDGVDNGPFMGGLGNPVFSRSVNGHFNRWQLEPGAHLHEDIESAFLAVRWVENGRPYSRKLRVGPQDEALDEGALDDSHRQYQALFPVTFEHWQSDRLPADIRVSMLSPQLPDDSNTSALPVTLLQVTLTDWKPGVESVSVALFWPNLMGWSLMPLTSAQRRGRHWPNQTHAGQINELVHRDDHQCHLAHRRHAIDSTGITGEAGLSAQSDTARLSVHLTVKANQNETGVPYAQQPHTLAWLEQQWLENGHFTNDTTQWSAHWHEPLLSAVCAEFRTPGSVTFALTFDWPEVRFGQGRRWWRAYTDTFGRDGRNSAAIAELAFRQLPAWLGSIDAWQRSALEDLQSTTAAWTDRTAGAVLNENWSITAGGTAWVNEPLNALGTDQTPWRHSSHFGWLEGFDSGYFYYNTLDLYVYAFPALSALWPDLAQSIFDDYLDTATLQQGNARPIYRSGALAPMLAAGKLPHDLGSPAEDPWVALNGYVMRDDPNVWKDHNPSFIVSYYLHRQLLGKPVAASDLDTLDVLADFIKTQLDPGMALPVHQEFGDSTWDNLDMRGLSTYTSSWVIAAWAAMARLWEHQGDPVRAAAYATLVGQAQAGFERLWAGGFYRTNSEGKYRNATQCDALIGVFYARLAGLGDLLPVASIRQHLETVWENNVEAFHQGRFGPLLVAEPGRHRYGRDGGEELQVNEVIVGSAWVFVAMLAEYGLEEKARSLADQMVNFQYHQSGLQFRTPAAWDSEGQFRAPLNMRPLSIAWLGGIGRTRSPEQADQSR